jgi:hypothetical protein
VKKRGPARHPDQARSVSSAAVQPAAEQRVGR